MRFAVICLSFVLALALDVGAWGSASAQPSARVEARASARERSEAAALQKAERLAARGKTDRAARELARSLRQSPSDALLVRYAELALPFALPEGEAQEKALRESAELFATTLMRRAEHEETLPPALALSAAWAEALRDEFASSQGLIARYARADDARTLLCLRAVAALALRRQQPAVARAVLTLARSFAPSDPELASELGMVALAQGDTQSALTALAERFAQDPSSLLARRDFAYALSAAGRPAEGYALLGVAIGACGHDASCQLERARWAFEAGMLGEALAAARVLLEREPEHLDGLFLAADALLAQGELDQARLMYQTILRIAPGNLRATNALSGLTNGPSGAP
jgi:tetratricopeptide (TPR) repeat protein